ncbi:MAG: hypothetical protein ACI91J_002556, partial [Yoonia sp.]
MPGDDLAGESVASHVARVLDLNLLLWIRKIILDPLFCLPVPVPAVGLSLVTSAATNRCLTDGGVEL